MISDCLAKYTNTTCAHMNNAKAQTQVILVHVDVVHRPTLVCKDDQSEPLCICLARIIFVLFDRLIMIISTKKFKITL